MTLVSPETRAEWIDLQAFGPRAAFQESAVFGTQQTRDALWNVWDECRHAGWDGYGAQPVEEVTYHAADTLIELLPIGFPHPSIGAEPDGQLTLEWRKGPRRVLSVSVDPDGYLHYAGLFGTDRQHGTLTYYSSAPGKLLQLVREL